MQTPKFPRKLDGVTGAEDLPLQQVQLTPGLDKRGRVPTPRLGGAGMAGHSKGEKLGLLLCAGLFLAGGGLWMFHRATAQPDAAVRRHAADPNALSFTIDETTDPSEALARYTKMLVRFAEKSPGAEQLLEARLAKPVAAMTLPELQLLPGECQRAVEDHAILRAPLPPGVQAELGSGVVRLELAPGKVLFFPLEWFKKEFPELLVAKVRH